MEWKCLKAEPTQLYLEKPTMGVSVYVAWWCWGSQPLSNAGCHALETPTVYRPGEWGHVVVGATEGTGRGLGRSVSPLSP